MMLYTSDSGIIKDRDKGKEYSTGLMGQNIKDTGRLIWQTYLEG